MPKLFQQAVCVAGLVALAGTVAHAQVVPVVPFYNWDLEVSFYTAYPAEIASIQSSNLYSGWHRNPAVGTFQAWASAATAPIDAVPVCRFYWPQMTLHFFTAFPAECAGLIADGSSPWLLETPDAFYVLLPDILTGGCAANTFPVYRIWTGYDHFFATSEVRRAELLAVGYISEGYGELGVAFCTPRA